MDESCVGIYTRLPSYISIFKLKLSSSNIEKSVNIEIIIFGLSNMSRASNLILTCASEDTVATLVRGHTTSHPWTRTRPGLPESGWHPLSDSKETDSKKHF